MPNEKFVTVGWQCDDAAKDATACKRIFVPTLGTVTRILRPSFPPLPPCTCFLWKLFRTSAQPIAPSMLRLHSEISYCGFAQEMRHPLAYLRSFDIYALPYPLERSLHRIYSVFIITGVHLPRPLFFFSFFFFFAEFDSNLRCRDYKRKGKKKDKRIFREFFLRWNSEIVFPGKES